MPVDIAKLTAADFEPRIHDEFQLPMPTGPIALRLVEVRRLGQTLRQGGAFSLLFHAPAGPILPQATYPLEHRTLGTLDIFLVPLGPRAGGISYEAVFA